MLYLYQSIIFLLGHLHFFLHFFFTFMENPIKKHPIHCNQTEFCPSDDPIITYVIHQVIAVQNGRPKIPTVFEQELDDGHLHALLGVLLQEKSVVGIATVNPQLARFNFLAIEDDSEGK